MRRDVNDYIKVDVKDAGSVPQILRKSRKKYQDRLRHRSGCREDWQSVGIRPINNHC